MFLALYFFCDALITPAKGWSRAKTSRNSENTSKLFLFLYNVFFLFIQLLEKAGFVDVKAIDNTKRFIEVLTSERARFETEKNTFLKV